MLKIYIKNIYIKNMADKNWCIENASTEIAFRMKSTEFFAIENQENINQWGPYHHSLFAFKRSKDTPLDKISEMFSVPLT